MRGSAGLPHRSIGVAFAVIAIAVGWATLPAFARHTPGPTYTRGTVSHTNGKRFTFVSPSKGAFHVHITHLTEFMEHEKRIKPRPMRVGMHVGVHGYIHDRSMAAIEITIYPSTSHAPPKETTLRGYVVGTKHRLLFAKLGHEHYRFKLAKGAKITYRDRPARLSRAKPGERVDVRYYKSGSMLLATSVLLLVIQPKPHHTTTIYGIAEENTRGFFTLHEVDGRTVSIKSSEHVDGFRGYPLGSTFTKASWSRQQCITWPPYPSRPA
jgi:hypothetical protein